MKYFFKSIAFKIVLSIILIICGIVLYTVSNPNDNIISNTLSCITVSVQRSFSYVSRWARDFAYQFEEKEKLEAKNEYLQKEINDLREKTIDYYDVKRENLRFEKYYEIKKSDKSLKFVSACVIGKDSTEFFEDLFIDKGSNSGISLNDAVITENGLIGRVCGIASDSARIKTVLSPECKIGVINSKTGDSGIISGSAKLFYNNLTRITLIPAQSEMQPSDIIVTSAISGMYPKDLKLGQIKSIEYDDYESSYYALVEPFENIKNVKDVFVITDFQGKGAISILKNNKK